MSSFNYYLDAVTEEERLFEDDTFEKKYETCSKNHHDKYIDIGKLCLNLLPEGYRNSDILYCVTLLAGLTGRIEVPAIPNQTNLVGNQEKGIYGTGFVQAIREGNPETHCPCKKCKGLDLKEYSILTVTTVNHVVADNAVAGNATMLLETPEMYMTIDGYKISKTDRDEDTYEDWCAVEFVSHEIEQVKILKETLKKFTRVQGELYDKYKDKGEHFVAVIGYPHGYAKKVSFGETKDGKKILKEVRAGQEWCRYEYDAVTCPGSSGSPVFILGQPICGYGYWFGHSHNHSKALTKSKRNASSVGVDKR